MDLNLKKIWNSRSDLNPWQILTNFDILEHFLKNPKSSKDLCYYETSVFYKKIISDKMRRRSNLEYILKLKVTCWPKFTNIDSDWETWISSNHKFKNKCCENFAKYLIFNTDFCDVFWTRITVYWIFTAKHMPHKISQISEVNFLETVRSWAGTAFDLYAL